MMLAGLLVVSSLTASFAVRPVSTGSAVTSPGRPCLSPSKTYSTAVVQASSIKRSISGSTLPSVQRGKALDIGPFQSSKTISLELVFSIRNRQQFEACLASIETPGSPNYRHFMDQRTLAPYMPTPGEKASVASYLKHEGFKVSYGASPLVIGLKGTVKAVENTFGVKLGLFKQDSIRFFAAESNPSLPQNFAAMTAGITGLDNYTVVKPEETPCGVGSPDCPQGLQVGYGMAGLYSGGYNGAGVTVAVVDGPGDPDPQGAIDAFDLQYGLPPVTLSILYPDGPPASYDPAWASETAMDIEAVHSMAPGAGIALLYDSVDPMNAVDYVAANHIAGIVSNSWGYGAESLIPTSMLSSTDSRLMVDVAQGLTILFASGDNGAYQFLSTEFPASDPNVLSVGATDLNLIGCTGTTCAGYGSEDGASISGGGFSGYFAEPNWQTSAIGTRLGRGVPDVSMLGYSPGFWVYSTLSDECGIAPTAQAGWFGCAGTSLSAPLWAGFLAVAFQAAGKGSFGDIDPLIYSLGSGASYSSIFHDIVGGSNGNSAAPGYSAGPGWDPVTGWGSPIGGNLAPALAAELDGPILASTTPTIDSGQSASFVLSWSGGTSPFALTLYYGSDSHCSTLGKQLDQQAGITGSPLSFAEPGLAVGTDYVCATVTDSGSPPKVTATPFAATVFVNPALSAGAITPLAPSVVIGQSVTLAANPSGGTSPYSYQWYTSSDCSTAPISGATSSTYSASPTSATTYYYRVTDSASPAVSACSAGDTVTVKAAPSITTTLSHLGIIAGQSVTDSAVLKGGYKATGTVTYEYFSGGACSGTPTNVGSAVTVTNGVVPNSASHAFKTVGTYSWKAVYSGDKNNGAAASPCERLTVLKATTAPTHMTITCTKSSFAIGAKVTCTAKVTGTYPSHTGTITWSKVSGTGQVKFSSTTCTLSSGKCSATVTATVVGSITIEAVYSGDSHNPWSSGTAKLTVTKAPTITTISCKKSSLGLGRSSSIICTATATGGYQSLTGFITWSEVSGPGRVAFYSDLACPQLGTMSCTATVIGIHAGSVKIEATYSGDSNNLGSSGTKVLTVT